MTTWIDDTASVTTAFTDVATTAVNVSQSELLIGGGFKLLIGDTYNLIIQPSRSGTVWTDEAQS